MLIKSCYWNYSGKIQPIILASKVTCGRFLVSPNLQQEFLHPNKKRNGFNRKSILFYFSLTVILVFVPPDKSSSFGFIIIAMTAQKLQTVLLATASWNSFKSIIVQSRFLLLVPGWNAVLSTHLILSPFASIVSPKIWPHQWLFYNPPLLFLMQSKTRKPRL